MYYCQQKNIDRQLHLNIFLFIFLNESQWAAAARASWLCQKKLQFMKKDNTQEIARKKLCAKIVREKFI